MDINVTLFGEMITFGILVWVMMKYIWPPLIKLIEERQKQIADGLEAARRGQNDLKISQERAKKEIREAKNKASIILDKANKQAISCIEEGKEKSIEKYNKILDQANQDIEIETNKAKEILQKQTADLVIASTEKILRQKIDVKTQEKLIDELIAKI